MFEFTSSIWPNAMLWLLRSDFQAPTEFAKKSSTFIPRGENAVAVSLADAVIFAMLPTCRIDFGRNDRMSLEALGLKRSIHGAIMKPCVHTVSTKKIATKNRQLEANMTRFFDQTLPAQKSRCVLVY